MKRKVKMNGCYSSKLTAVSPVVRQRNVQGPRGGACIVAAGIFLFLLLVSSAQAMDRFEALSQIESGDNDRAIGPAGEVSRYQITPAVVREFHFEDLILTNRYAALWAAEEIMEKRTTQFAGRYHHPPTDREFYLLWNCPADADHPSKTESARAQRFANLCGRK